MGYAAAIPVFLGLLAVGAAPARAGDAPRPVPPPPTARAAEHAPTRQTVDLGHGVTFDLVRLAAGRFAMGSPTTERGRDDDETQHAVEITKPFWMATTEVTQAVWAAVMGDVPSRPIGATLPVNHVSWHDGQAFVGRLNQVVPGGGFRLPTEAEWEYACRAGSSSRFATGDDESGLSAVAWYDANAAGGPHPVGSLAPNAWGLFDLHGNVSEWVEDPAGPYEADAQGVTAHPAGRTGSGANYLARSLRGGSWKNPAAYLRCANRGSLGPSVRTSRTGLRLARTVADDVPAALDLGGPTPRETSSPTWTVLRSRAHLLRELAAAGRAGQATVVCVWADWCHYCRQFDLVLRADPQVAAAFGRLVRLRLDVTESDVAWEGPVRRALGIPQGTQPYMVFVDAKGRLRRELDLSCWPGDGRAAAELLRRARAALRGP